VGRNSLECFKSESSFIPRARGYGTPVTRAGAAGLDPLQELDDMAG
jgi:hypothetical protein